jgi:small nuclear ribonucleoprotein (snRNP)-like protein
MIIKQGCDIQNEMVDINGQVSNSNSAEPATSKSPGRLKLESWLNKNMKIQMTDGRTLIGIFLCTDRDQNIILGSCTEYLKADADGQVDEPRVLGLAMVPGHHVISIHTDQPQSFTSDVM